jgi:hypothetical protein
MKPLFSTDTFAIVWRPVCFFLFALSSLPVFGQMESVEAHIELVSEPYYDVNDTIWQNWMYLHIDPDDPDDLGTISVVIYNHGGGGEVLTEIVLSRQELIDLSLFDGETIVMKVLFHDPQLVYRVEVYPQTLAGSYTLETIFTYPE